METSQNSPIKKGMILSAGLGTRLAPVTESLPKPLVPVLNIPNIVHNLHLLRRAGIHQIIVNTHYLGEAISEYLKNGQAFDCEIHYSKEENLLLGTGGGLKNVESFFSNESLVLCNADFVTNIDVGAHIKTHFERSAIATMVLLDDAKKKQKYAAVGTNEKGHLVQLPSCHTGTPARTGIFTGIHILNSESIFPYLKAEPSGINQVLYPQLMQQFPAQTFGDFAENRYWFDTGEIPVFWKTSIELLERLFDNDPVLTQLMEQQGFKKLNSIWTDANELSASITGPAVVSASCQIESEVEIGPYCILGEGAHIATGSTIKHSVLLPNAKVPEGSVIEDEIVYKDQRLVAARA